MSNTPRTDALEKYFGEMPCEIRALERELAAVTAERDSWKRGSEILHESYEAHLIKAAKYNKELRAKHQAELDALAAMCGEMRTALEKCVKDIAFWSEVLDKEWSMFDGQLNAASNLATAALALTPPAALASAQSREKQLREALVTCETRFRQYAEIHLGKLTPDYGKAQVNKEMADLCAKALSPQPEEARTPGADIYEDGL